MRWSVLVVALLVVLLAAGVGGFFFLKGQGSRTYEMAQLQVKPQIDFKENPPDRAISSAEDKKKLLQDILPLVPEVTTTESAAPAQVVEDVSSNADILKAKIAQWKYRSFMQVSTDKTGTFEHIADRQTAYVKEGLSYDGINIDKLMEKACIVSVGDATATIPISPREEEAPPAMGAPGQKEPPPGPPATEEERKRRYDEYTKRVRPTFDARMAKYTPGPNETVVTTPPSEEQIETAKAGYFETMRPTIEASTRFPGPGEQPFPPQTPPDPELSRQQQAEWVATQRAVQEEGRIIDEGTESSQEDPGVVPEPEPNQDPSNAENPEEPQNIDQEGDSQ